jgi:ABC-type phosphate transport system substrate-binding protein
LLSCALAALLLPSILRADEVVVIGAQNPTVSLTQSQVRDVFLGRTTSVPDGSTAIPVDQPDASPLREAFYLKVTNRSAAQARAQWAKLYFTGRGVPPREGASNDDVKKILHSTKGAIGYIDRAAVDNGLRIVLVLP